MQPPDEMMAALDLAREGEMDLQSRRRDQVITIR
jgi:hypothetical protein